MTNTGARPSPRPRVLVGYTRGGLRGQRGKLKGGPANSRGGLDTKAHGEIGQRCMDHGFRLTGWLADSRAAADLEKGPEELLRLQEAVFLVRADLVDGVYVHRRRDIPDLYWPNVAAEILTVGVLIVGNDMVTGPETDTEDPVLVELGRLGADVRKAAFPRYTEPHDRDEGADLDLGASDCREGAARVAHKLIRELNWPGPQVAELMADAEYTDLKPAAGIRSAGHGPMLNKSLIHRLVHEAEDRKWVSEIPRDRTWDGDPMSASPGTRTLTLLQPGSPARFTAESWLVPWHDLHPTPTPATLPENSLDLELALAALRLLPFAVLVIPDGAIFATPARRALVIGEAWAANMTVVYEGLELAPAASIGDSPATLGAAALSAARFHRARRVHDRATVCVNHLCDLSVALREAEEAHLDAFGSSALTGAQAVAALLDRAIPTPSGTGAWSRSTARAQRRKRPPGTQPM